MIVLDLNVLASFHADKPGVKILAQSGHARIALFGFRKDQILKEHVTSSPITVQVISGKIDFETEYEHVTLLPGELLILGANITHKIVALEDSIVLAYITPNPEAHTLQKEIFDKLTPMTEISK